MFSPPLPPGQKIDNPDIIQHVNGLAIPIVNVDWLIHVKQTLTQLSYNMHFFLFDDLSVLLWIDMLSPQITLMCSLINVKYIKTIMYTIKSSGDFSCCFQASFLVLGGLLLVGLFFLNFIC